MRWLLRGAVGIVRQAKSPEFATMRLHRLLIVVLLFPAAARADVRPNFILFLTDDQRWDCLSCAGHPALRTPHIDRLAAEGIRFRNAFVTTSICCVSRASFITGRIGRNHRVGDFQTPLPPDVLAESFPALLKKAGYRTGCFGKWGIGGPPPQDVFDVWDAWGDQGTYFLTDRGERVHNSEYLARRAISFLQGCKPDQPFCLIVLFKSPHDKQEPDSRDAELFKNRTFAKPVTATAAQFDALPEFTRKSLGRRWALRDFPTEDKYQEYVRQYLRCIAGVDRAIGEVMDALKEKLVDDHTMVVFGSDNGYFLGERGLIHKWLMYEESIRIPLIIRYPAGVRPGRVNDEMVLNIDVARTFLDYAGVWVPKGTDGRSLRPLLQGSTAKWRDQFFYEHHYHNRGSTAGAIPRCEGIRTTEWKYVTYIDEGTPYEELFDLKHDPHETKNLATDARYRDTLLQMRNRYNHAVSTLPPAVLPKPPKK